MLERPLHWVGSAKRDFLAFPQPVIAEMGYALGAVQLGAHPPAAKPWKGEGPGVFELIERHDGDTYRVVYTVRFETAVYVLHAFQKKSPTGIKTATPDIQLIAARLRAATADYRSRS